MTLNRDDILQADDIEIERVPVPEWAKGKSKEEAFVCVRGMSGTERDDFEAALFSARGKGPAIKNIRAKLASYTICDEAGGRLFTDAEVLTLGKKSARALQRIFVVAQRLSGIGENAITEYKEALEEVPFDGSVSDSRFNSAVQSANSSDEPQAQS